MTLNEICSQIYELFIYNPKILPEEVERLRDISDAYSLLLYHYKKRYQNFDNIKVHIPLEVSETTNIHTLKSFIIAQAEWSTNYKLLSSFLEHDNSQSTICPVFSYTI